MKVPPNFNFMGYLYFLRCGVAGQRLGRYTDVIPKYDCSHAFAGILLQLWLISGGQKKSPLSTTMS